MQNPRKYDAVAMALHWMAVVLIVAALALGVTVDDFPKEMTRVVINTHSLMGLAVLVLAVARLVWRLVHPAPPLPPSVGPLMRKASGAFHAALYLLMVAVPLIGVPTLLYRGRGLDFGLWRIASPFERTPEIFRPLTEVHEIAAFALIGLAVGHALAALYHQYVRGDDVLLRMLPGRRA